MTSGHFDQDGSAQPELSQVMLVHRLAPQIFCPHNLYQVAPPRLAVGVCLAHLCIHSFIHSPHVPHENLSVPGLPPAGVSTLLSRMCPLGDGWQLSEVFVIMGPSSTEVSRSDSAPKEGVFLRSRMEHGGGGGEVNDRDMPLGCLWHGEPPGAPCAHPGSKDDGKKALGVGQSPGRHSSLARSATRRPQAWVTGLSCPQRGCSGLQRRLGNVTQLKHRPQPGQPQPLSSSTPSPMDRHRHGLLAHRQLLIMVLKPGHESEAAVAGRASPRPCHPERHTDTTESNRAAEDIHTRAHTCTGTRTQAGCYFGLDSYVQAYRHQF